MAEDDVRRYELPFGAQAPAIVNAGVGIRRLLVRGDSHSYTMRVTLLDAPDHRLVRAGVVLAHRVVDGVGEWYLSAPDWAPFLPAEEVEAVGEDLPTRFGQLIRPFRRGAALGPAAGLEATRTEYLVRGEGDVVVAHLRDEQVTVTRGGLTTARYREVTVTPAEATEDQLAWIDEALVLVGAARVRSFPSFVARLGAPATGMSDLPSLRDGQGDDTMEAYVQAVLGAHLHSLFAADLAVRSGSAVDIVGVKQALRRLRRDLRGLYPVLDATWLGGMLGDIDDVLGEPDDANVEQALSETYSSVLDRLVQAVRVPRLGDVARRRADEVLARELRAARATFCSRAHALTSESSDDAWEQALASGENVVAIAAVCRPLLGKAARVLHKRMAEVVDELAWCAETSTEEPVEELAGLDPVEAFRRGRAFERDVLVQSVARDDFVDDWKRTARRIGAPEA